MNKTILEIILCVSGMCIGMMWGISIANDNWRRTLIEKNVAEWQVDKDGNTYFVIKSQPQGERL
jgi:hypothetical protein